MRSPLRSRQLNKLYAKRRSACPLALANSHFLQKVLLQFSPKRQLVRGKPATRVEIWRSKWSSHIAYEPGTDPVAHVASHALTPRSAASRQRPPARSPGQLLGTSAQRQPASNALFGLSVARCAIYVM